MFEIKKYFNFWKGEKSSIRRSRTIFAGYTKFSMFM